MTISKPIGAETETRLALATASVPGRYHLDYGKAGRRRHPYPILGDTRRVRRSAPVRPPGDPTVPRTPVSLEAALAETRRHIDSSAGPDRAREIDGLRDDVARAADRVQGLAQEAGTVAMDIRHESDQLQRAVDALRDAESAKQTRQAWLDAHAEVLTHLDDLAERYRRGASGHPGLAVGSGR